jgi:hypothetical protein
VERALPPDLYAALKHVVAGQVDGAYALGQIVERRRSERRRERSSRA